MCAHVRRRALAAFLRNQFLLDGRWDSSVAVARKQDRGGEYRSLLGVPGGLSGPMAAPIKEEAARRGLTLREGNGGDPDTLMRNTVGALQLCSVFPVIVVLVRVLCLWLCA